MLNRDAIREECLRDAAEKLGADTYLSLHGMSLEEIKRMGEHSMWAMLSNLFEINMLQTKDVRLAGAMSFSMIVQHQQQLMRTIEEKHGIELHVEQPNEIRPSMSRRDAYNLGHHDVLMKEIRSIQRAKVEGKLPVYASESKARLQEILKVQAALHPTLPCPEGGWIPESPPMKESGEAWMYIWGEVADGMGEMVPLLARVTVDSVNASQVGEVA